MAFTLTVIVAYAGCWWVAAQMGLRGWPAHVPAVLFVTSSFYVSNLYGRADFPEAVGTSAISLVAASGLWLARADRWRPLPLFTFLVSVFFLTGTHPETAVWGFTLLAAGGLILWWSAAPLTRVQRRRVVAVLGVAVLGVCLDLWSLIPTALYNNRLLITSSQSLNFTQLWYTSPHSLFAVARDAVTTAPITGNIQAQMPTLAILWSVVAIGLLWRRISRFTHRLALGFGALVVLFAVLAMLRGSLTTVLPWPWRNIQFAYRLVTYGTLSACLLVAIGLLSTQSATGRLRSWTLIGASVVVIFSVGAATKQSWSTPSFYFANRSQGLGAPGVAPVSYYPGVDYSDTSASVVKPKITSLETGSPLKPTAALDFPYATPASHLSLKVRVPRNGTTVATNIATGPYMVKLAGAVPVGRTATNLSIGEIGQTLMVVRLTGKPGSVETVTVSASLSPVVKAGIWLSLAAALTAIGLLLIVWRSRWPADGRWVRLLGEPLTKQPSEAAD
jgi:hypothetical protein